MKIKWLIYCRVSSKKQVKEWNWLSSQEKRCRDYTTQVLWLEVEKVFNDEWVSWWLFERKSIRELFNYIDTNKNSNYIVIFEDLNRLSRDIQVHSLLKAEFKKRWVELACPNFKFEESPEWDFKENISVIVSQYEKDKNKQRVLSRMQARIEQWYWCFKIPIWYKYIEAKTGWKIIIKDPETSDIIKSWLEKYSQWLIVTLSDLLKYYFSKWIKITWINNKWEVNSKAVIHRIVTNILYTGHLECEKWNIPLIKAQHEAIISMKTYEKIQKRLKSMSKIDRKIDTITTKNISNDFPLRWFLYCEKSWNMLSWWWSTWSHAKYPYYFYPNKSPMRWKWINRDTLEKEFCNYLKTITPNENILKCFQEIFLDKYKQRNKIFEEQKTQIEKQVKEIDQKIDNYIDRIWNTDNQKLIKNYEEKIDILEKDKEKILEKMTKNSSNLKNVWTNLKSKLKIVSNALLIRNSQNLENKKNLVKIIFPQGIPINEKRTVWTANLSLIYQAFEVSKKSKSHLVELMGFEPMSREVRETHLLS